MAPPIRVLQIVDDSPHSEYAFKWACDHILLPRKGGELAPRAPEKQSILRRKAALLEHQRLSRGL